MDPMEKWTAASDEPKELSMARVKDCHLCILLVGFRLRQRQRHGSIARHAPEGMVRRSGSGSQRSESHRDWQSGVGARRSRPEIGWYFGMRNSEYRENNSL